MPPLAANGGSSLDELEMRWSGGRARERMESRPVGGGDDDFAAVRSAPADVPAGGDDGDLLRDPTDDEPLFDDVDPAGSTDPPGKRSRLGWRLTMVLLALAVLVNTDVFIAGAVAPFGNATRVDGLPNARGTIVQAVLLVAMFSLVVEGVRSGLF
jgi:hypothetical protein